MVRLVPEDDVNGAKHQGFAPSRALAFCQKLSDAFQKSHL